MGQALSGSRNLFALAEQGDLPAFFGRVHPRFRTPVNAIVFIGRRRAGAGHLGDIREHWRWQRGQPTRGLLVHVRRDVAAEAAALRAHRESADVRGPLRAGDSRWRRS